MLLEQSIVSGDYQITIDVKANQQKIDEIKQWCEDKNFSSVYIDEIVNPSLSKWGEFFGATFSRTFKFKDKNEAVLFKLRWC